MVDLLFFLLLGHFIGDFALQSDRMAEQKRKSAGVLSIHVLIYTVTVGVFLVLGLALGNQGELINLSTLAILAGLYVIHWLQDFLKSRKFNGSKQGYYLDQAAHILILFCIRIFVYNG